MKTKKLNTKKLLESFKDENDEIELYIEILSSKYEYLNENDVRELLNYLPSEVNDKEHLFNLISDYLEKNDYLLQIDEMTHDYISCIDIFEKDYDVLARKRMLKLNQLNNVNKMK